MQFRYLRRKKEMNRNKKKCKLQQRKIKKINSRPLHTFLFSMLFFFSPSARLHSFTHAQARHVFRRAQSRSPAGRACTPTTRPLSGDFAAFLVLARKRISFFTDMRMLPPLHWRAPSCFLDVPMQHALACIGKVVTGSLTRILLEYVTCIHMCTKRCPDI
jgi:hypothetical protein